MTSKINPWFIVKHHYATLVDYQSRRPLPLDYSVMVGLPIGFGLGSYLIGARWTLGQEGSWLTFSSIFLGFLLNLLVFVFGILGRTKIKERSEGRPSSLQEKLDAQEKADLTRLAGEFVEEVFHNVAYSLLVAVCMTGVLGGIIVISIPAVLSVLDALFAVLVTHFMLTLLMLVKRVHSLWIDRIAHDQAT